MVLSLEKARELAWEKHGNDNAAGLDVYEVGSEGNIYISR